MSDQVFLTGFPGFLGSELVRRILAPPGQAVASSAWCRRSSRRWRAQRAASESRSRGKLALRGRIELVAGDITRAGPRPRRSRATLARDVDRDLPPRRGLRPRGPARGRRRRSTSTARDNVLDFAAALPAAPPPPVRLDLLRLGALRRHLPRERPRARPGVQQLLRGDQVPRRGRGARADGGRAAGDDLPSGDRGRRLADRRDAEVRRPVLRPPLAAQAADRRGAAGARRPDADAHQPRAARLRDRRDRRALGVRRRRRASAISSPTPTRRPSTRRSR